MQTQLRIYTINRGALQTFTEEWEAKIYPLRLKIGFQVLGAWKVEATNQFIWFLAYNGSDSWEAMDKAYFESEERQTMIPDPARHIARIEQYFVESALPGGRV
jgi:hypothetical protein